MQARYQYRTDVTSAARLIRFDTGPSNGTAAVICNSSGTRLDQPIVLISGGQVPTVFTESGGTLYVRAVDWLGNAVDGVVAAVTPVDTQTPAPDVLGIASGAAATAAQNASTLAQMLLGSTPDADSFAEIVARFAQFVLVTDPRLADRRAPVDGSVTGTSIAAAGLPQGVIAGLAAALASMATKADLAALTAGSPAELDTFLEIYNRFLGDESTLSTLNAAVAAKYTLPGGGVPLADLTVAVQAVLTGAAMRADLDGTTDAYAFARAAFDALPAVTPASPTTALTVRKIQIFNCTNGDITAGAMPPLSGLLMGSQFLFERTDSALGNKLTIPFASGQGFADATGDGLTSYVAQLPGVQVLTVARKSDGTKIWRVGPPVRSDAALLQFLRGPETVRIGAANARNQVHDVYCKGAAGTQGVDDDGTRVNAALAALGTRQAKIVYSDGLFHTGVPISSNQDGVTHHGQGERATVVRALAGMTSSRRAAFIFGDHLAGANAGHAPQDAFLRDMSIVSDNPGSQSLVANSGHGVIMRSPTGRIEHVEIQSPELCGVRLEGMPTYSGVVVTLSADVTTAPTYTPTSPLSEDWSVTDNTVLNPAPSSGNSSSFITCEVHPAVGFDPDPERVSVINVPSAGKYTVVRGVAGSPIKQHPAGQRLLVTSYATMYDMSISDIYAFYPGQHGLYVAPEVSDYEVHLFKYKGGLVKPGGLSTARGQDGIHAWAGGKYFHCHAYFAVRHGFYFDALGASAGPLTQILGGATETNGQNGVFAHFQGTTASGGFDLMQLESYRNNNDFVLSDCQHISIHNSKVSSNGGPHVQLTRCSDFEVAGMSQMQGGANNGGVAVFASTRGRIHHNGIFGMTAASPAAVIIDASTRVTVDYNQFDHGVIERNGSDWNRVEHNGFMEPTTPYTTPIGITLTGARSRKWGNRGYIAGNGTAGLVSPSPGLDGSPSDQVSSNVDTTLRDRMDLWLTGATARTVTTFPAVQGFEARVTNTGTVAMTIAASSGQINGAATFSLAVGASVRVSTDGTNFRAQ